MGGENGGNIFLKCKMPVIAHINKKTAVYVKYHSAKRKLVGLNTFECNIVVPFGALVLTWDTLNEKEKRNSITYLPLLPSFERRNVLKPFENPFLVF